MPKGSGFFDGVLHHSSPAKQAEKQLYQPCGDSPAYGNAIVGWQNGLLKDVSSQCNLEQNGLAWRGWCIWIRESPIPPIWGGKLGNKHCSFEAAGFLLHSLFWRDSGAAKGRNSTYLDVLAEDWGICTEKQTLSNIPQATLLSAFQGNFM